MPSCRCSSCGETKPKIEFHKGSNKGGCHTYCKDCAAKRAHDLWENDPDFKAKMTANGKRYYQSVAADKRRLAIFGLTIEDYDRLLAEQGGLCYICSRPPQGGKAFSVDHDHETGLVRGLLCSNCNHAIGLLHEDKRWLRRAAEYLDSPPAQRLGITAMHVNVRDKHQEEQ